MTRAAIRNQAVSELLTEPEVQEAVRLFRALDKLGVKRQEYDLVSPWDTADRMRRMPGFGAWK